MTCQLILVSAGPQAGWLASSHGPQPTAWESVAELWSMLSGQKVSQRMPFTHRNPTLTSTERVHLHHLLGTVTMSSMWLLNGVVPS